MMQQHWDALMASVGIDTNPWLSNVGELTASIAHWEDSWDGAMARANQSAKAFGVSLDTLEHQIGLAGKEAAEFDKRWSAYAQFTAQEAIDQNERLAKSLAAVRAQEAKQADRDFSAYEKSNPSTDASIENQRVAAEAQRKADAARHAGYEQWWKDELHTKEILQEVLKEEKDRYEFRQNALRRFVASGEAAEAAHEKQLANAQREVQQEQKLREARETRMAADQRAHSAELASLAAMTEGERAYLNVMEQVENQDWDAIAAANAHAIALDNVQDEAAQTAAATAKMGRGGTMAMFELSRGIEDAAVGYSLNGIRGLVMGCSNNLARMAEMGGKAGGALAMFGPYAAMFVTISAAIYTLWANFKGTKGATEDATEALDKYIERQKELRDIEIERRRRPVEFAQEMAGVDDAAGSQAIADARHESQQVLQATLDVDQELFESAQRRSELRKADIEAAEAELVAYQKAREAGDLTDAEALRFAGIGRVLGQIESLKESLEEAEADAAQWNETITDNVRQMQVLESERAQSLAEAERLRSLEAAEAENLVRMEQYLLSLEQQRTAVMERQAQIAAEILESSRAAAELQGILDPGGEAVGRVMRDTEERQVAIDADSTMPEDERAALTAQNQEAMHQQLEELFDVERLDEFNSALGRMVNHGELTADEFAAMVSQVEALREQFDAGTISLDQFNNSVEHIDRALEEAAQAAEEAAEAERRAALLRGDWEGAGLDPEQALEDRLAAERMREFNEMMDDEFDARMGRESDDAEEWRKEMERLAKEADKAADALHKFQGNPQEATDRLWDFMNSIEGQIQNTQNSIALMENTLAQFGDDMDIIRKNELRSSIDDLTDILNLLYEQQRSRQFITEVNGPAFFNDPGLQSPDDSRSVTGGRGRGGGAIFMEFPNIDRLTNSAVGEVVDRTSEEMRRRGIRTL